MMWLDFLWCQLVVSVTWHLLLNIFHCCSNYIFVTLRFAKENDCFRVYGTIFSHSSLNKDIVQSNPLVCFIQTSYSRHQLYCSLFFIPRFNDVEVGALIARFMGPTWGPSGADRTQVGPMLAPELCYLGDYTGFTLSVAPSVPPPIRLWTESCVFCIFHNINQIHFMFARLIKQVQKVSCIGIFFKFHNLNIYWMFLKMTKNPTMNVWL